MYMKFHKNWTIFWILGINGLKLGKSLLSYHDEELEIFVVFYRLKLGESLLSYHDEEFEIFVVF